jgi:tRNA-binding EMAP/Myf-like protein
VAGQVVAVSRHPNAVRIWLAFVDLGDGLPVTIVFGGRYMVQERELVPVAPPGARVVTLNGLDVPQTKKMRNRKYRGQRSHGMLCSLDELGWIADGPDEVAVLRRLKPGDSLDLIDEDRRVEHVVRPWCFRGEADTVVLDTITERRAAGSPNFVESVGAGNAWFDPPAARPPLGLTRAGQAVTR